MNTDNNSYKISNIGKPGKSCGGYGYVVNVNDADSCTSKLKTCVYKEI